MKRMYRTVAVLLTVCICLCGCSSAPTQQDNGTITTTAVATAPTAPPKPLVVDNETAYDAAGTRDVDIDAFIKEFVGSSVDGCGNLQTIYDEYGGVCLRKTQDGTLYSVHKVKQGGILYIYYRENPTAMAESSSARWFYVCDNLSYADYEKHLQKNVSTIEDVIALDASARVFREHYLLHKQLWDEGFGFFVSDHYLQDGILEIVYNLDGVVQDWYFVSDFRIYNRVESKAEYFNAKVLDRDVIKSEHVLKTP